MPIKLNDPSKAVSERFKRKDVKDMVVAYRTDHNASDDLKFTHFTIKEMLELFIDNKILDPGKTLTSQMTGLDKKGVKLYLGKHFKESTCTQRPGYLNFSNVIICNTDVIDEAKHHFKDMLDDTKHNSFMLAGQYDGLDMGSICPPDCPVPEDDDYDVAY